jgi:hypothetical protein
MNATNRSRKKVGSDNMTKDSVEKFFERYEQFFVQSLDGKMDGKEISSLYAQEFIAASPIGVMAGKNDVQFQQAMMHGYEHYRKIGTKRMRVREVSISQIDELHCMAHVAWTAIYTTVDNPNIEIDFEVHYLMQKLDDKLQIFGWISGDEQRLLKEYGVI